MSRDKMLIVAAIVFFSLAMSPERGLAQVYQWKFASYVPPVNKSLAVGQKEWAKKIEERSNGRIKIKIYWGRELVGPKEMPTAVKTGLVDVVGFCPAYTPGQTPMWGITMMHFLPPSPFRLQPHILNPCNFSELYFFGNTSRVGYALCNSEAT